MLIKYQESLWGQEAFCFISNLTLSQIYIVKLIRYAGIQLKENEIIFIASQINISQIQTKKDFDLLLENKFIKKEGNTYIFNKLYNEEFKDDELYYISIVTNYLYDKYLDNPLLLDETRLEYLVKHLQHRDQMRLEKIKTDLLQRSIKNSFTISEDVLNSMSYDNDHGNLLLSIVMFNLRKYDKSRQCLNKIA